MFGDRARRDAKRRCQLAYRRIAAGQSLEDGTPRGVGERAKGAAEPISLHLEPHGCGTRKFRIGRVSAGQGLRCPRGLEAREQIVGSSTRCPSGYLCVDLKSIRAFVQVAEASGFRRASSQLSIRQSVLSRRVRELEEELGVSLLERHRSGARLTIAGRAFLATARSALAELEYGARRAAHAGKGANGQLRIGIFASIASGFSYDAIAAFLSRHKGVAVEIAEGARPPCCGSRCDAGTRGPAPH